MYDDNTSDSPVPSFDVAGLPSLESTSEAAPSEDPIPVAAVPAEAAPDIAGLYGVMTSSDGDVTIHNAKTLERVWPSEVHESLKHWDVYFNVDKIAMNLHPSLEENLIADVKAATV